MNSKVGDIIRSFSVNKRDSPVSLRGEKLSPRVQMVARKPRPRSRSLQLDRAPSGIPISVVPTNVASKRNSSPFTEENQRVHHQTWLRTFDNLLTAIDAPVKGNEVVLRSLASLAWDGRPAKKRTIASLKQIIRECEEFITYDEKLKQVVKIQSAFRRWQKQKQWRTKVSAYRDPQLMKRNAFFREMLKSEKALIYKLEIIVGQYFLPLREAVTANKPLISKSDIHAIFSTIEGVLSFHRKLKEGFEKLEEEWPCVDNIGDVFLKQVPALRAYGDYVENIEAAVNHLQFLQQSNTKFSQFLYETSSKIDFGGFTLELFELLTCPLNQVNQYELHLENIINSTPPSHPGYSSLMHASALMEETNKYLRDAIVEAKNRLAVVQVQRTLMDNYEVLKQKRRYIGEWDTKQVRMGGKKARMAHVFLFNDAIIFTLKNKEKQKVLEEIPLAVDAKVVDSKPDFKYAQSSFDLVTPKTRYTVVMNSPEESIVLFEKVESAIEYHNIQVKVFGIALHNILEREHSTTGIPSIVEKILHCLSTKMDLEGVFRISPSSNDVTNVITAYDRGRGDSIDFEKINPHVAAALLKSYLRTLPEPVFCFDNYPKLLELADVVNDAERLRKIKDLVLTQLPQANYVLLKCLVTFLHKISTNSKVNLMTSANLAIVFGPNLCRPRKETIETTLSTPRINLIVGDIIEHVHSIFTK